jgi:hypothetical protein
MRALEKQGQGVAELYAILYAGVCVGRYTCVYIGMCVGRVYTWGCIVLCAKPRERESESGNQREKATQNRDRGAHVGQAQRARSCLVAKLHQRHGITRNTPAATATCRPDAWHKHLQQRNPEMVPRGLEPRTLRLLAVRSNQLSYETRCFFQRC